MRGSIVSFKRKIQLTKLISDEDEEGLDYAMAT